MVREVRKFLKNRKINETFSCYVKRLSNEYGKNSKSNKFYKILDLQKEKSANFAKITRLFLAM